MVKKIITLLCGLLACDQAIAGAYAMTIYRGEYTDNGLLDEILLFKDIKFEDSYLVAIALSKEFDWPTNNRHWEYEGQLVKHFDAQEHWEVNALFNHRWKNYRWDNIVKTTFAIGSGISYATQIPPLEVASHTNSGASKTLIYLLLEATFQLPTQNDWAFVARIHHRSGLFRLINDVKGGSNNISFGVKWYF
jgi:hypothetical protein